MIIVLAEVPIAADRMREALALSKAHVARSRKEAGCSSHAVYVDPDQENNLVFVEEWASEEALYKHFAVPESDEFASALGAMATARPRMRLYKAAELPFPGRSAA